MSCRAGARLSPIFCVMMVRLDLQTAFLSVRAHAALSLPLEGKMSRSDGRGGVRLPLMRELSAKLTEGEIITLRYCAKFYALLFFSFALMPRGHILSCAKKGCKDAPKGFPLGNPQRLM